MKDKGVEDRAFSLVIIFREQRSDGERAPDPLEDVHTMVDRFFAGHGPSQWLVASG